MLVPAKPNPVPGLALAALPPAAVGGFSFAFLSWVGGLPGVWRLVDAAGPYSLLLGASALGVMGLLSGLLCLGLVRRPAPLVVMLGLGMLPWLLGIAGTQEAVERVLAALPDVGSGSALAVLVAGVGEAMVTRLLGAWTSAALLVGVGVGLLLLSLRPIEDGGETGGVLGAVLGLALGGVALLVALEAHHLFELLTSLAARSPEARLELLAAGTTKLLQLHALRSAALGALGVLALVLVGWQFFLQPEAFSRWAGSLTLAALAMLVVLLDAHPLHRAAAGAREADLPRALLPTKVHEAPAHARGPHPGHRARSAPPGVRVTP